MTAWVWVVIASLVACSSRTVGERERALQRIPAQAQLILAANGAALGTPAFRRVIDSLTSHVPPSLACVVEASTSSEAIAIGVQLDVATTIVLVTRATVDRCPALSKIAEHTYVATVGAGAPANEPAASILAAPGWDRARPYLLREPLAIAAELPSLRLVAVAQPDPLDAWIAVDAHDAAAAERAIKSTLDRLTVPATIELAGKLNVTRTGTQVAVHAENLSPTDLVTIAGDVLGTLDAPAAEPGPSATFPCPPQPGNGIVSCHDGTQYKVSSVATIVRELGAVDATPVIAGGDIVGIRLVGEPARLLRRDDVILAVDAHRITAAKQLIDLAPHLGRKATLAVRRNGVDAAIELGE